jgi:hypothetical protein
MAGNKTPKTGKILTKSMAKRNTLSKTKDTKTSEPLMKKVAKMSKPLKKQEAKTGKLLMKQHKVVQKKGVTKNDFRRAERNAVRRERRNIFLDIYGGVVVFDLTTRHFQRKSAWF